MSRLSLFCSPLIALASFSLIAGCSGEPTPTPKPDAAPETAPVPAPETAERPEGPLPTLLMVQAHFDMAGGRPKPQPAKLVMLATDGKDWFVEELLDEKSNVFHKAMAWGDGFLTIGAEDARLLHWTRGDAGWTPALIWEQSWGGKFDRLRDIEIGDVTGDGKDNLVIATHDQGVVAVGTEAEGAWTFVELSKEADVFVHEIEIGDVDGDGKNEFYATPSERNRASGVSQPGGVSRYIYNGTSFDRSMVVEWEESHAKEILVADLDGNGTDELYTVREAHTKKEGKKTVIVDPVKISRVDAEGNEVVVAELDDKQCRFLAAGDVNGDGKTDLVAAGMDSGLWLLEQSESDTMKKTLIDAKSGGFEHATHLADLDGDGTLEIYVAADKQKVLRRYTWNGQTFARKKIRDIPSHHITWNIQDAKL